MRVVVKAFRPGRACIPNRLGFGLRLGLRLRLRFRPTEPRGQAQPARADKTALRAQHTDLYPKALSSAPSLCHHVQAVRLHKAEVAVRQGTSRWRYE